MVTQLSCMNGADESAKVMIRLETLSADVRSHNQDIILLFQHNLGIISDSNYTLKGKGYQTIISMESVAPTLNSDSYDLTGEWYWRNDDIPTEPTWRRYPEDLQSTIEMAYKQISSNQSMEVTVDGKTHVIFPITRIAMIKETGAVNYIAKKALNESSAPRWSYGALKDDWTAYPEEISLMIDNLAHKLDLTRIVKFEFNDAEYRIDLFYLTQTNIKTKYQRPVLRKEKSKSKSTN